MPTPDFDEWMARQEIDIEDTLDIESWQGRIEDTLGYEMSPKQAARASVTYADKYETLMPYGIRPVTYTYEKGPRTGQEETRWVIWNIPGLWSDIRMREILEWMRGE